MNGTGIAKDMAIQQLRAVSDTNNVVVCVDTAQM